MADRQASGRSPHGDRPVLRYEDLLSNEVDNIQSKASALLGHQAFAGNQPDDFAIAGRSASAPRILMLGLGLGGSIRSILAANPAADIIAIDVSRSSINLSRAIYNQYFPAVSYQDLVGDAREVRSIVDGSFDAICVDLYEGSDYPEFMTNASFWESLTEMRRGPASTVMVNAWGIPTHLGWHSNSPIQRAVAQVMRERIGPVSALPHRRNVTLVSSAPSWGNFPELKPIVDSVRSRIDMLQLGLLRLRANAAIEVSETSECQLPNSDAHRKSHSDMTMNKLWGPAVKQLLKAGRPPIRQHSSLTSLLDDPDAVAGVAANVQGDLRYFLPNVASNWLHDYGTMPGLLQS